MSPLDFYTLCSPLVIIRLSTSQGRYALDAYRNGCYAYNNLTGGLNKLLTRCYCILCNLGFCMAVNISKDSEPHPPLASF